MQHFAHKGGKRIRLFWCIAPQNKGLYQQNRHGWRLFYAVAMSQFKLLQYKNLN